MELSKVHLITFYTEGEPYDKGYNLKNISDILEVRSVQFLDSYKSYSFRSIRNNSESSCFSQEFPMPPNHPKNCNINYNNVCFGAWKPYIIYKRLQEVEYGDIVMYHDINSNKYKMYFDGLEDFKMFCNTILSLVDTDIFLPFENPNLKVKSFIKDYTIKKIVGNPNQYYDQLLLLACMIIVRKTDFTMSIIKECVELCKDISLLSPIPNPNPHKEFKWHTFEQGIFNMVLRKKQIEGLIPKNWSRFWFPNRIFRLDNIKSYGENTKEFNSGFILNKNIIKNNIIKLNGSTLMYNKVNIPKQLCENIYSLHFIKNSKTNNQWFGKEIITSKNDIITIQFNIMFKNYIPNYLTNGLKHTKPHEYLNNWFYDNNELIEINKWYDITETFNASENGKDEIMFCFDNTPNNLEVFIYDFKISVN